MIAGWVLELLPSDKGERGMNVRGHDSGDTDLSWLQSCSDYDVTQASLTHLHNPEKGDLSVHDLVPSDLLHVVLQHLVVVCARQLPLNVDSGVARGGDEHNPTGHRKCFRYSGTTYTRETPALRVGARCL